jgi:hypothetical protein
VTLRQQLNFLGAHSRMLIDIDSHNGCPPTGNQTLRRRQHSRRADEELTALQMLFNRTNFSTIYRKADSSPVCNVKQPPREGKLLLIPWVTVKRI